MIKNFQSIRLTIDKHVARLTLSRPETHNAFHALMLQEMTEALTYLKKSPKVRVLQLVAQGHDFCAGADIHWMAAQHKNTLEQNIADAHLLADFLAALYHFHLPVLAQVQGRVRGGGIGLLACADWVVADQASDYALSEVRLGLIPATIMPYLLQAIPRRQLLPLIINAQIFDADTALSMGLIHACVGKDQLSSCMTLQTQQILENGPEAVQAAKSWARTLTNYQVENISQKSAELIADLRVSKEGQEGMSAFLQKRQPRWPADD
ncbi:MAG: enoyl-CoA hydratase/isomerase family protein [Pseudomonadales bacterium]|nr:enoyl-CoA hydratase/isomerase family protein [Pseudomonadales bacterium]